jgi:hypothetical protein
MDRALGYRSSQIDAGQPDDHAIISVVRTISGAAASAEEVAPGE